MTDGFSRRGFLQAAGATAAVAVATGYSPLSYAQNEKVRVGAIGTGGQGSFHLRDGMAGAEAIEIVAVCDVYRPALDNGWKQADGENREVKKYMDYREMLDKEQLDAVMIATPLNTHFQIASDCLDAGKYVFLEKTMCYTLEECRKLVQKCHDTGLWVQVGHQRRYNPKYNKVLWLAREQGLLGRMNHITAQWHRNNDWRRPVDPNYVLSEEEKKYIKDLERHINWRLYTASSGGLMTELATHQLDVAAWYLGTPPSRVFGYGGIDYWRDGREVHDNVVLVYEFDIDPSVPGFQAVARRSEYQKLAQLNRPYTVRLTYSSITANAKRGAAELIQGDDASVELTEGDCFVFGEPATRVTMKEQTAEEVAEAVAEGRTLQLSNTAYTEGQAIEVFEDKSVDRLQFEAFANDIQTGGTPKANQIVGLIAAAAGLAGTKSMNEGVPVEIDPAWFQFDFETPDPYRYEFWDGPEEAYTDDATPA